MVGTAGVANKTTLSLAEVAAAICAQADRVPRGPPWTPRTEGAGPSTHRPPQVHTFVTQGAGIGPKSTRECHTGVHLQLPSLGDLCGEPVSRRPEIATMPGLLAGSRHDPREALGPPAPPDGRRAGLLQ